MNTGDVLCFKKNLFISILITFLCSSSLFSNSLNKLPPSAVWVSTPDNQWVNSKQPMDSRATIEAAFDMWKKVFNVKRVYWRGSQVALWMEEDNWLMRPEHYTVESGVGKWWKKLIEEVGTNKIAIETAHKMGMEIWMNDGLFEHGSQGTAFGFPAIGERRLRIENPEWVPVDRHGLRKQGGPICFAYPKARKALVEMWTNHCVKHGYDGIMFYTYVENFSMRYQDEFGFNEPIVQEYKRRYGVNIRNQAFDKTLWAKLRGEYVTTFLAELKNSLSQYNKKLGVVIYRRYDDGHYPAKWFACPGSPEISLAGRIYLDWEQWMKDGIVDDLAFYAGAEDQQFMDYIFNTAEGTACDIHVSTGNVNVYANVHKDQIKSGVRPFFYSTAENQFGYRESYRSESINDRDPYIRLRVLRQVQTGSVELDVSAVAKATEDENVLVRVEALRAMRFLEDNSYVKVIENCLNDPENSVRIAAVKALGPIQSDQSLEKIFKVLKKRPNFMLHNAAVESLRFYKNQLDKIETVAQRGSFYERLSAVKTLSHFAGKHQIDILIDIVNNDISSWIKAEAISGLGRIGTHRVAEELLAYANKPDNDDIARRAIEQVCKIISRKSHDEISDELRQKAFDLAITMFSDFGKNSDRPDREWGYRPLGNMILQAFGEKGRDHLYYFWKQEEIDGDLSDKAYKVLFINQFSHNLNLISEQQAINIYEESSIERMMWPWRIPNIFSMTALKRLKILSGVCR